MTPYTSPVANFKPGDKITSSGYPGSVVRIYIERQSLGGGMFSGAMIEIRLPGGVGCVSERDIRHA